MTQLNIPMEDLNFKMAKKKKCTITNLLRCMFVQKKEMQAAIVRNQPVQSLSESAGLAG